MKKKRILIADDDDALVRVMTVHCRHLGVEVRSAPDAMMALTHIHRDPPDLAMIDVNMPAGNGLSVCEMLANDPRLASIPIIVFTGSSDEQTLARCQAFGAHYVLKSPDAWVQLKALIPQLIGPIQSGRGSKAAG